MRDGDDGVLGLLVLALVALAAWLLLSEDDEVRQA